MITERQTERERQITADLKESAVQRCRLLHEEKLKVTNISIIYIIVTLSSHVHSFNGISARMGD